MPAMLPRQIRSGQGAGEVHPEFVDGCNAVSDAMVHMCVLLAVSTGVQTYVPHRRVRHLYAPDFFRLLRFHAREISRSGHEGVAHHSEGLRRGDFPTNPIEMAQRLGLDVQHVMRREPPTLQPRDRCACGLCSAVRQAGSEWDAWEPEAPVDQVVKEMIDDCSLMVLGRPLSTDGP